MKIYELAKGLFMKRLIVCLTVVICLAPSLHSGGAQVLAEGGVIDVSYLYRESELQTCEGATLLDGEIHPDATCSTTVGLILLPIPFFCVYVGLNATPYWCALPICPLFTLYLHLGNCLGWCFVYI